MERHKKDIPLVVHKAIQPFLTKHTNVYHAVKPDASLVKIEDYEEKFFFRINGYEIQGGRPMFKVSFKPKNEVIMDALSSTFEAGQLEEIFKQWSDLVVEYEEVKMYDEDPIVKKYQDDFYITHKSLDENADIEPFDLQQQLYIDEYLDESIKKIKKYKATKKNKILSEEIGKLENEIEETKRILTREPKNRIIKRLSKIWGWSQKIGLQLLKEIFVNVLSDITTKFLSGGK